MQRFCGALIVSHDKVIAGSVVGEIKGMSLRRGDSRLQ